jgi:L-lactate dehydrogenase (cytochrome)/(S)-mandelate dehydrogenase
VIIGPTGLSGLLWPRGEEAAARAAAAAGTVYTKSHGSTVTIEDLAREVAGPKWFQVFLYRDRSLTQSFVERAQAAGYKALVLTIDNQVLGQRERDVRNGFTIPPRLTLKAALDAWRGVPWALRMGRIGSITLANYVTDERKDVLSIAKHINDLLDPALSWRDVAWLREIWSGPLILKGVLHPEEARIAIEHGVDGVLVSNHGGRQLDTARPSIAALPAIVDAVAGRIPVLLDGGVRRGADVVKAVALGATACLIGRPHLWGLAVAGEAGAAAVLDIYRRDIDRVLALGGWDGITKVPRDAVHALQLQAAPREAPVFDLPRRAAR